MAVNKVNNTVELVKLWGNYEAQYPNGTIEDFCRQYLASQQQTENKTEVNDELRPDINGRLIILLRRIGQFHMVYSNKALEGTGLNQIEEFGILVTIYNYKNPIKSEAIFNNIIELSSGSNMLIRMKKRGLVNEHPDPDDKRVKRLKLTEKGQQVLINAKDRVLKVAHMLVHDLTDQDKQLCMQLLGPINARFTNKYQKQRLKAFEDIYKENMA